VYVFFVERHIISKETLRGSKKHVGNPPHTQTQYGVRYDKSSDTHVSIDERNEVHLPTKQCYEVVLKINHAMTHMPRRVKTMALSKNKNILMIENVMEMLPSTSR